MGHLELKTLGYGIADVRELTGVPAFARGSAAARSGLVTDIRWAPDGRQVSGRVGRSNQEPCSATVVFRMRRAGIVPATGACTCDIGANCEHVAALLVAALGTKAPEAALSWRSALDPMIRDAQPLPATEALGLQFVLSRRGQTVTLGVRPVHLNDRGRWAKTGAGWRDLLHAVPNHSFDGVQVGILRDLHAVLAGGRTIYSPAPVATVDGCSSETLWTVLTAAVESGIVLIGADPLTSPVVLAAPAHPAIDLRRTDEGLTLEPMVLDGDTPVARYTILGSPAIGIYSWTGADIDDARITLAPFRTPLTPAARAFLHAGPVVVPAADEAQFITEAYRRLARVFAIVSRDGSFAEPVAAPPVLHLEVVHGDTANVTGTWTWRYSVASAPFALPLDAADAPYRDPAAESAALAAVTAALSTVEAPLLTEDGAPVPDFQVGGLAAVQLMAAIDEVKTRSDVVVAEEGARPRFRRATAAPRIRFSSSQAGRDWFDLEVEVSVGEEQVPLRELFLALASGEPAMVLPGGVWFPLDDARFDRLRELIDEARALSETPTTLRLSRYHASLVDDLADVGEVDARMTRWRHAAGSAGGFDEHGDLLHQPLPEGLTADLRPYQHAGFDWLAWLHDNALGGVLADDMGLGKTVQALALVARCVAAGERVLVIAPTSVVPNWLSEARRFVPQVRTVAVAAAGRRGMPLDETIGDADLVITSYTLFRIESDAYERIGWNVMLLDEAQFVKNRATATHRVMRRIDVPVKIALTGTPVENGLADLWALLAITAPGMFPSERGFLERYQRPIEQGDGERLALLRRRIRPLLMRRTKELVAPELPERVEQIIEVELGEEQRHYYETVLSRERARVLGLIGSFDRNRLAVFRALTRLRQAALSAALVDDDAAEVPSAKLDLLDELLADALAEGHRILVFSQFTGFLGLVRSRLQAAGTPYAYLDGSTRRREEQIDRFRGGDAAVFLISLKAGGFGLNLAEADYCVLLDPWWNPAAEAQAVDRAHRIGQTRTVVVYRLVAKDTVEEKVMALKATKAAMIQAVLAGAAGEAEGISAEDVRELLA